MARPARPASDEQRRPGQGPQVPGGRAARHHPEHGGPFLCYLTIDGLDRESDPRKAMLLRGRINAAARTAAEQRQTTYHATDSTITIGIHGPDAQQRVDQLRDALAALITKHGWTTRNTPR
jgi:hypothetical protein